MVVFGSLGQKPGPRFQMNPLTPSQHFEFQAGARAARKIGQLDRIDPVDFHRAGVREHGTNRLLRS